MDSTVKSVNKWLKTRHIDYTLTVPAEDMTDGFKYGVLFLKYLSNVSFPSKLSAEEVSLLKVVSELADEIGDSASGGTVAPESHAKKRPAGPKTEVKGKVLRTAANENSKAGNSGGVKKLAPLSKAEQNLQKQKDKGCSCKGDCRTKVCGCRKKDNECVSSCKCGIKCVNKSSNKSNSNQEPNEETSSEAEERSGDDLSNDQSDSEEEAEHDHDKENVDWNRHLSSLVQCEKCTRKFFPDRIQFHSKVCLKV